MLPISDTNPNHHIAYIRATGAQEAANSLYAESMEGQTDFVSNEMKQHAKKFSNFIDDVIVGKVRVPGHEISEDEALAADYARDAVQRHTGALEYLDAVRHDIRPRIRRTHSLNRIVRAMETGRASNADFDFFHAPALGTAERPDETPFDLGYHLLRRNPELMPEPSPVEAEATRGEPAGPHAALSRDRFSDLCDTIMALPPAERADAARTVLASADTEFTSEQRGTIQGIMREYRLGDTASGQRLSSAFAEAGSSGLEAAIHNLEYLPLGNRILELRRLQTRAAPGYNDVDQIAVVRAIDRAQTAGVRAVHSGRMTCAQFAYAIQPLPQSEKLVLYRMLLRANHALQANHGRFIQQELEN